MTLLSIKTSFIKKAILLIAIVSLGIGADAQSGGATYVAGPTMKRAKIYPTSTVLPNGKVISFGGREYNFVSCSYADMYDPVANSFTEAPMNYPHDAFATVKLTDGRFFILGGGADLGIAPGYSSTEMYNPVTNTFSPRASMTMGRMQLAGAQLTNGKVLIVGGWYNNSGATYGEVYDTAANTFTATDELNEPRAYPIVMPATDGGAIIAGGWPSYGGSIIKTVEYYNPTTNKFSEISSELIPADEGWLLNPIYTRPVLDSRMANGNYLLLASRAKPLPEYALIMFNPTTKAFSKLNTTVPLKDALTDGGFFDLTLNKTGNFAYIMGVDSGYNPQRLSLVAVDLSNGKVYHPTTTFALPSQEYFYAAMTFMPSNGKILVQGINSSNASYFYGTNKTYLLTPEIVPGAVETVKKPASLIRCYPNPANNQLNIEITLGEPSEVNVRLVDMVGKEIICDLRQERSVGKVIRNYDTGNLPKGFYKLLVQTNNQSYSQTIVFGN